MKRWIGYLVCISGLCALFTTCYYISFRNALNQFNERTVERDSQILRSFQEYQKQAQILIDETTKEENDAIKTDTRKEETITPATRYFLETYQVNTNELSRQELRPNADLIGLNRAQLIEYLSNYMKNIPLNEKNKGLYAYDLLQFSSDEIVIRKSYNEDIVTFRYYLAAKDGKVIIYYSDLSTVYEYTDIEVIHLPESDRNNLMQGVYVRTEEELFSLLESYTS